MNKFEYVWEDSRGACVVREGAGTGGWRWEGGGGGEGIPCMARRVGGGQGYY